MWTAWVDTLPRRSHKGEGIAGERLCVSRFASSTSGTLHKPHCKAEPAFVADDPCWQVACRTFAKLGFIEDEPIVFVNGGVTVTPRGAKFFNSWARKGRIENPAA